MKTIVLLCSAYCFLTQSSINTAHHKHNQQKTGLTLSVQAMATNTQTLHSHRTLRCFPDSWWYFVKEGRRVCPGQFQLPVLYKAEIQHSRDDFTVKSPLKAVCVGTYLSMPWSIHITPPFLHLHIFNPTSSFVFLPFLQYHWHLTPTNVQSSLTQHIYISSPLRVMCVPTKL